jgi:hypothetical protein
VANSRARRLAAAGALSAFVAGGVCLAAGAGTASAQTRAQDPLVRETCLDLPILPLGCESGDPAPTDGWSNGPGPDDTPSDGFSSVPWPDDSPSGLGESHWSAPPAGPPPGWRPEDDKGEPYIPRGAPHTGAGGLAEDPATWPFAAGGALLVAGAGLAGYAVRRRRPASGER